MRTDTIFDMASVSKLFTSIAVMQQVEAGRVDIDEPVARLPAGVRRQRQGVDHRQAAADAHLRPGAVPRRCGRTDPDIAVADQGRDGHRADDHARHARTCTPT